VIAAVSELLLAKCATALMVHSFSALQVVGIDKTCCVMWNSNNSVGVNII